MSKLLITGGTGSFGSAMLARAYKDFRFSEIRIFSRDETKQFDLMQNYQSNKIKFFIGDVRDYDSIFRATEGVDYIFHAAALKHVPSGEFFPMQHVYTNVLGTKNVFAAAQAQRVKKVILLSTDKAVSPINTMGMTKAIAEKLMTAYAMDHSHTIFCAVRYGNVMASRGSVIPLFVDQIQKGRNLTITNPDMTRFLLSLDDSMNLVDMALRKGERGNIFIKKAPATTIKILAEALLDVFNKKNRIRIVGTRKGEKIHEALASSLELSNSEDLGNFYRVRTGGNLDYMPYYTKGNIKVAREDYTSANTQQLDKKQTIRLLRRLPFIKNALKRK